MISISLFRYIASYLSLPCFFVFMPHSLCWKGDQKRITLIIFLLFSQECQLSRVHISSFLCLVISLDSHLPFPLCFLCSLVPLPSSLLKTRSSGYCVSLFFFSSPVSPVCIHLFHCVCLVSSSFYFPFLSLSFRFSKVCIHLCLIISTTYFPRFFSLLMSSPFLHDKSETRDKNTRASCVFICMFVSVNIHPPVCLYLRVYLTTFISRFLVFFCPPLCSRCLYNLFPPIFSYAPSSLSALFSCTIIFLFFSLFFLLQVSLPHFPSLPGRHTLSLYSLLFLSRIFQRSYSCPCVHLISDPYELFLPCSPLLILCVCPLLFVRFPLAQFLPLSSPFIPPSLIVPLLPFLSLTCLPPFFSPSSLFFPAPYLLFIPFTPYCCRSPFLSFFSLLYTLYLLSSSFSSLPCVTSFRFIVYFPSFSLSPSSLPPSPVPSAMKISLVEQEGLSLSAKSFW